MRPLLVDDHAPSLVRDVSIIPDYHFDLGAKVHTTVDGDAMSFTPNEFGDGMVRSVSDPGMDVLSCGIYSL